MRIARLALVKILRRFGYEITRIQPPSLLQAYPSDFDSDTVETIRAVAPYTMTSAERLFALCRAVHYVSHHDIPGDIVECGVWKGGSMMAVAQTLKKEGDIGRTLHLFDTFDGMAPAGVSDVTVEGVAGSEIAGKIADTGDKWCYAGLDEVKRAMEATGYKPANIRYIQGRVEDTIPAQAPDAIALLRLDTDWYESTKHELTHLFPRLSDGGVLIIDDYGFWKGCRRAVDEYFAETKVPILLHRIDNTGRIAIINRSAGR
jgi:hypothetical protein